MDRPVIGRQALSIDACRTSNGKVCVKESRTGVCSATAAMSDAAKVPRITLCRMGCAGIQHASRYMV